MTSDLKELFIGFRWKALCFSVWLSPACDSYDFQEPSTGDRGYRRKALCLLLISYPLSASPPPPGLAPTLFWLQWCFTPHLQPRSNGSCIAPPRSCHPAATSRLSVLTMEKSASTAIGKWTQRRASRKGAPRQAASRTLSRHLE